MLRMLSSLNRILNIGLTEQTELRRHQIRMVNLLVLICVSGTTAFSALYFFAFGSEEAAFHNGIFTALYAMNWLLTKEHFHRLAKYWLFMIFFLQQFIMSYFVLSENSENELLLLVVPTVVVLVFDPEERFPRYFLSLVAILLMFVAKIAPHPDPIVVLTTSNSHAAYLSIVLVFVMLSVVLMDFYLLDLNVIDKASHRLRLHDHLTRSLNQRAILDQAEKQCTLSKMYQKPLSTLCINIDDFRTINSLHGRQVGDKTLGFVADRVLCQLPETAVMGRYQGDSFIVLLPGTGFEQAKSLAEEICDFVQATPQLLPQCAIKATVSIGVATWDETIKDGIHLIDMASDAMQQAKAKGKNTVVRTTAHQSTAFSANSLINKRV